MKLNQRFSHIVCRLELQLSRWACMISNLWVWSWTGVLPQASAVSVVARCVYQLSPVALPVAEIWVCLSLYHSVSVRVHYSPYPVVRSVTTITNLSVRPTLASTSKNQRLKYNGERKYASINKVWWTNKYEFKCGSKNWNWIQISNSNCRITEMLKQICKQRPSVKRNRTICHVKSATSLSVSVVRMNPT